MKARYAVTLLASILLSGSSDADAIEPVSTLVRRTFVYKSTPDCKIHLDLYESGSTPDPSPVIVDIHGGALIFGSRSRNVERYVNAGYRVAAIDYRLAPETKLPEIVADVRDELGWIREHASELNVDPGRIGVLGGSAGGYLTLMTGTFEQKPRVLVSFYGYGDLIGDWLTQPHYLEQRHVSREEALKQVEQKPISEGRRPGLFYRYTRQTARWPIEVSGVDPKENPEFFTSYMPERNVEPGYPPTTLLHGTKDKDVPYEKSVEMAKRLHAAGVEHELITIEGAGHGFNGRMPEVQAAYRRVIAFLDKHLKR